MRKKLADSFVLMREQVIGYHDAGRRLSSPRDVLKQRAQPLLLHCLVLKLWYCYGCSRSQAIALSRVSSVELRQSHFSISRYNLVASCGSLLYP